MNRLFGFFKQKITQVKQQNKQQLQALASVLSQNEYSTERVLSLLQGMKSNYMNWNILIANEASTGLYYSQLHNRNICLKKIKGNKDIRRQTDKNRLKLEHIQETAKEIKEISSLAGPWMTSVNRELEEINEYLKIQKRKHQTLEPVLQVQKVQEDRPQSVAVKQELVNESTEKEEYNIEATKQEELNKKVQDNLQQIEDD